MEEFFSKTKICFGEAALQYLSHFASLRSFIVADPFLVESGMIKLVSSCLKENQYQVFSNVVPDPPLELVVEGIKAIDAYQPDVIIACGGGSAIDEAKAIKHFWKKMGKEKQITFIAIPTTSGTGSEVTSFAVITDKEKGIKYPLVDDELRPDVAILDPELVKSVPPSIVADTGMDVLTHALEAYVSTKANPFTDALAEKSALTVLRYLVRAYENKEDMEAKAMMHYGSCLAGIAFDAASLGLNHALAHSIGGKFHVPHGRVNAILLPYVLEFNAQLTDYQQKDFAIAAEKYARLAAMAGFGGMNIRTSVKNLIHQVQKMQKQMNMPVTFRECGIQTTVYHKEMEIVTADAQTDSCIKTNPRKGDRQELLTILKRAL